MIPRFSQYFAPTTTEEEYAAAMERFMALDENAQRYMLGCFTFDVHVSLREIGAATQDALGSLVHELERVLDAPSSPEVGLPEPAPLVEAPTSAAIAPPVSTPPPTKPPPVDKRRKDRALKPGPGHTHPEPTETADAPA